MIRGKFLALDDFDLAGQRLLNWKWLNDLPTDGAVDGQALVYTGGSVKWATLSASGVVNVDWASLTGVPTTFPPEAHDHAVSDINDFPATWSYDDLTDVPLVFTPDDHTHVVTEITDFPTTWAWTDLTGVPSLVNSVTAGTGIAVSATTGNVQITCDLTWSELANKPLVFPPEDHTHVVTDITDFPGNLVNTISTSGALSASTSTGDVTLTNTMTWTTLPNKPLVFPPEDHTHVVTDITDFPTTWAWTDLTGIPSLVNTVSGGTNINVSTSTGDVVISAPNAITSLTAGTNISVNGTTISVVDAPTFAGVITGESHLVLTGNLDIGGDIGFSSGGAITGATTITAGGGAVVSNAADDFPFVLQSNDPSVGIQFTDSVTTGELYFNGTLDRFYMRDGANNFILRCDDDLLASAGNLYANYNGPDGDSYLYFYEGSSVTGAYLRWRNASTRHEFSHGLLVNGDLRATASIVSETNIVAVGDITTQGDLEARGNAYINQNGPDGDSYLYFYENSSNTGAYLRWWDSANRFFFSRELQVDGLIRVNGSALVNTNVYINYDGPDGDGYLYFYEGGSASGAYLQWDDSASKFLMNAGLEAQGNIQTTGFLALNYNGDETDDSIIYFRDGSSNAGQSFRWDDSLSRFQLSTDTYVNGYMRVDGIVTADSVRSNGSIYVNYDGPEGDGWIIFYDGGTASGQYLGWDDSLGKFYATGGVETAGDLVTRANVYINKDGPDGDSYLYFYEGSSDSGAYLQWDDSANLFLFNKNVKSSGAFWSQGNLISEGDLFLNYVGPDGDSYMYFYDNSSPTNRYLRWNNAVNAFQFSTTLRVAGAVTADDRMYINYSGPDGDSYLHFYEGGSASGAYLQWDDAADRFELSNDLDVSGEVTDSLRAVQTSDLTSTSIVPASSSLAVAVKDGGRYMIDAILVVGGNNALSPDMFVNWTGLTGTFYWSQALDLGGASPVTSRVTLAVDGTNNLLHRISGVFSSTSDSTATMQISQSTSSGNSVILRAGSSLIMHRMN